MAFTNSAITFGATGLQGENVVNPTALDFSKTGNPVLFVTQQNGEIWRFVIEILPDGPDDGTTQDFHVASALKISDVKTGTQNYNDDGGLNFTTQRQMTGLVASTDANGNDVLYVNSSDWRVAVGQDSGLDTNSSQIHRLTLDKDTGAVLSNVAIVRGLPRSEENHSVNGFDIAVDPSTGHDILWVAVGANTNSGAPGNNFAGTVDSPYGGSVLKIDLTELSGYDVRTDGAGDQFILDLPTLDDPSRANVDLTSLNIANPNDGGNFTLDHNGTGANGELMPDWAGGNNVLNAAKITQKVLVSSGGQLQFVDNPVQIHSPGFRNPFDVLVTEQGEVFTWDNGPNTGWGGQPIPFKDATPNDNINYVQDWESELATNNFNESGSAQFGDQLHYLGSKTDASGPYGGFPSAIRAAVHILSASFNDDGSYRPTDPNDPVLNTDGGVIFANEAEARAYMASLLIIYEEQGNGNWVDITSQTGLPQDFHDIVSGYNWAHPGSSLSDSKNLLTGPAIADGTLFSPESQLQPGGSDGSLRVTPASTNGLAEYTGSNFAGALQGAIIAASFDGNLYFQTPVDTNADGRTDAVNIKGTINGFGSVPLDVTALGDHGLSSTTLIDNNNDGIDDFAGLVAAVTYGSDSVVFFVPGEAAVPPGEDLDGDGFSDRVDPFVGDPTNALGVSVGANQTLNWAFELSTATTPVGAIPSGDSIAGDIGINGVWRNGSDLQVALPGDPALYDPTQWNLGGASTFVSLDQAHDGSAVGADNDQKNVLGIGFSTAPNLGSVSVLTEFVNIFSYTPNLDASKTWDGGEKTGLVLGSGTQDTFVEATIAVDTSLGTPRFGLQLIVEENNVPQTVFVEVPNLENPVRGLSDPNVQLAIDINMLPDAESVTARVRFFDNGQFGNWVETPSLAIPPEVLDAIRGEYTIGSTTSGAFVGLVASTSTGDDSFAASWDYVDVTGGGDIFDGAQVLYRWNAGTQTVSSVDGGPDWIASTAPLVGGQTNVYSGNVTNTAPSVQTYSAPVALFAQERWDPSSGGEMSFEFGNGALEAGTYAVRLFMSEANPNAGVGHRVFDVSVEGGLFLDDLDLAATIGAGTGGMFEWTGQVIDGTIDIDFSRVAENPQINAVEIIKLDVAPPALPKITIATNAAVEGDVTTTAIFGLSKPVAVGQTVTIDYEIAPTSGGATPQVDYEASGLAYDANTGIYSGSVTIDPGQTSASAVIDIIADAQIEGSETFEVRITNSVNATVDAGAETATVSIEDLQDKIAGATVGDLSDDRLNPTVITLANGDTTFTATQEGGSVEDHDYVTLVVDSGFQLESLTLTGFNDYDPNAARSAFLGIQAGTVFTEGAAAPNFAALLGGVTYDETDVNADLLPDMADGVIEPNGSGTIGFTTPLEAGSYTLWLSQTGAASTSEITATVAPAGNSAPVIAALADQTVDEGDVVTVTVTATDADLGDQIVLGATLTDASGDPVTGVSFVDNGDGTGQLSWTAPDVTAASTYTAAITASDGVNVPTQSSFDITVNDVTEDVVYRWNAGNTTILATDGGLNWVASTDVLVGGPTNVYLAPITSRDPGLASSVPQTLFSEERWDPASGQELALAYGSGALAEGNYTVRLFFGEVGIGAKNPGDRIFDISIENQLLFNDFNIIDTFGVQTGGAIEWTGNVSDGTINVDFQRIIENPFVNGMEIVRNGGVIAQNPPTFVSSDGFTIDENQTIVGSVVAQDSENDPLTYSITGGDDASKFTIDPTTGQLSFVSAPNFEAPTDADESNTYDLTVGASDETATSIQDITVTVADVVDGDELNVGQASAQLTINANSTNVQETTYAINAFRITNTGAQAITNVVIDISDALYPDMVFDPYALAGDAVGRGLAFNSSIGNTGAQPAGPSTYIGAGGTSGYHAVSIDFSPAVGGGFGPGEQLGFNIDLDPNSIAGANNILLDNGTNPSWATGAVSGAELIGSSFIVTFADGSTATGQLHSDGSQGGAIAAVDTAAPAPQNMTLSVNSVSPGGIGTYNAAPVVTVSGPAGQTARIVLTKGFIQPVINELTGPSAAQLDAQLATLGAQNFPANNAAEFQVIDVVLNGTVQDISSQFSYASVAGYSFDGDDKMALGFTAAVIDPSNNNVPIGPVTDAIYLRHTDTPPPNTAPTIAVLTDVTTDEAQNVSVAISASDPDTSDTIVLSAALVDASGTAVTDASFTDNGDGTGQFDWVAPFVSADTIYTATITATDGTNAPVTSSFDITVEDVPTVNTPPTLAAIADIATTDSQAVSVAVSATDPDPTDSITLTAVLVDGAGAAVTGVSFVDNGDGTGQFDWTAPDVVTDTTYTATVTANDGTNASVSTSFDITVQDVSPLGGTILHRWNAGNQTVSAIDGGPDWAPNTSALVGGQTNIFGSNLPTLHSSVGSDVPLAIFAQERWDPASGDELELEFGNGGLANGTYMVRLFLGDNGFVTSAPGDRVFDVTIEDQLVFDDLDLIATIGNQVGGEFQWTGTVSDGTLDIDFMRVVENPLISGLEIRLLDDTIA